MKKRLFRFSILFSVICILHSSCMQKDQLEDIRKPVIMASVEGGDDFDINRVPADRLTHIYYSFAGVNENKAILINGNEDVKVLKQITTLKESFPSLKVLISVACRNWCCDSIIDSKAFARSVVELLKENNLDGVDINWAYPDSVEDEEDSVANYHNYIEVIRDVKRFINQLGKEGEKEYLLSCTFDTSFLKESGEIARSVQDSLDYIVLKTYDFMNEERILHQSNLYVSEYYEKTIALSVADESFYDIASHKKIIAIPFYGMQYKVMKHYRSGIGDPYTERLENIGYTYIKDKLVNKDEYYRYWDKAAQAPFLYNFYKNIAITYDDEESVKLKCQYVMDHNLGGVMISGYNGDPKNFLLKTISRELK